VLATDKSEGMLAAAPSFGRPDNLRFARWDVLDEAGFPDAESFDLIVSSVMVQYLRGEEVAGLVPRLAARLIPGGQLVFVEQDLVTNALAYPSHDLFRRVYDRDAGKLRPHFALGMRPILRAAGLALLPPASFLWTTYRYGPYMRDLNERMADDALARGRIQADERAEWTGTLEALDASGDFYYGLVYHRIAGRRGHSE
jgi:SAM-dependent methyltransferase